MEKNFYDPSDNMYDDMKFVVDFLTLNALNEDDKKILLLKDNDNYYYIQFDGTFSKLLSEDNVK
jgi:hypothetical protein